MMAVSPCSPPAAVTTDGTGGETGEEERQGQGSNTHTHTCTLAQKKPQDVQVDVVCLGGAGGEGDRAKTHREKKGEQHVCSLSLLALQLLLVEFQLSTLQNVAVSTTALSGAAGQNGEKASAAELVLDVVVQLQVGNIVLQTLLGAVTGVLTPEGLLSLLLLAHQHIVLLLQELAEGSGIDGHHSTLHQCVCAHVLVVGGIVHDTHDAGLLGEGLRAPAKVSVVQTHGTELGVATTGADGVNTLLAQTGDCGGTAKLELALLLVNLALSTSEATLVPGVTRDTHAFLC